MSKRNLLALNLKISAFLTLIWVFIAAAFGLRGAGLVTLTVAVFCAVMFVLTFFQAVKR